jgi:hypothetical protein
MGANRDISRADRRATAARQDWHGRDALDNYAPSPWDRWASGSPSTSVDSGQALSDALIVLDLIQAGQRDAAITMLQRVSAAGASVAADIAAATLGQVELAWLDHAATPGCEHNARPEVLLHKRKLAAMQAREAARLARADAKWLLDQITSGRRYRRDCYRGPAKVWLSTSIGSALEHGEALPDITHAGGCHRASYSVQEKSKGACAGLVCTRGVVIDTQPLADTQGLKRSRRTTRGKGRKVRQ